MSADLTTLRALKARLAEAANDDAIGEIHRALNRPRDSRPNFADLGVIEESVVRCALIDHGPMRRLEPKYWEALRQFMQRLYRRATGEEHAILVVSLPDATLIAQAEAGAEESA